MQRTRKLILDYINRHGASTVDDLAGAADVVPVTIRAHLAVLEKDGLIAEQEMRTGRAGRPRIFYSLTPQAREVFPKGYDHLTLRLLRVMGKEDIEDNLMGEAGAAWATSVLKDLPDDNVEQRVAAATKALDDTGCDVEWLDGDVGDVQIKFHNCPYTNVVTEFPETCEMERGFLQGVLGIPIKIVESGPDCIQCVMVPAQVEATS